MNNTYTSSTEQTGPVYQRTASQILDMFDKHGFLTEIPVNEAELIKQIENIIRSNFEF